MDSNQRGGSQTARMIWAIAPPVISLIGIIGNITVILVFLRKQKPTSTTLYLTYVAVGDLTVMLFVYPRWWFIYVFATDIRLWNDVACKLHIFVTYGSAMFANTILAVVTIERIISVIIPYKAKLICTRKYARRAIGLVVVIVLVWNSHLMYGYRLVHQPALNKGNSTNDATNVSNEYDVTDDEDANITNDGNTMQKCGWIDNGNYAYFYKNIFERIFFVWCTFTPQVIFLVGAAVIIWKMTLSQKLHHKIKNTSELRSDSRQQVRQITFTLMLINIVFLISTLPVNIFLLTRYIWIKDNRMTTVQEILWAIFNQLFYVNHAANFILFSISGRCFRQDVSELYGCKSLPESRSNSETPLSIATLRSNGSLGVVNTYPSGTSLTTVS